MARSRILKPGFFTNDELAEVTMAGRLLFAGLWCMSDREGRLHDRPKRIKAEVLPFDNVNVERLLKDLATRGFIIRYAVGGEHYIAIPSFKKHQSPHVREPASTIPAPPDAGESTALAPDKPDAGPVPDVGEHQSSPTYAGAQDPVPFQFSSVSPGPVQAPADAPAGAAKEPPAKRITDAFRQEMRDAYPGIDEEEEFERATNHVAYRKAIDKQRYYRNWLRKSAEYAAARDAELAALRPQPTRNQYQSSPRIVIPPVVRPDADATGGNA